jgi:hypothetical protein
MAPDLSQTGGHAALLGVLYDHRKMPSEDSWEVAAPPYPSLGRPVRSQL